MRVLNEVGKVVQQFEMVGQVCDQIVLDGDPLCGFRVDNYFLSELPAVNMERGASFVKSIGDECRTQATAMCSTTAVATLLRSRRGNDWLSSLPIPVPLSLPAL